MRNVTGVVRTSAQVAHIPRLRRISPALVAESKSSFANPRQRSVTPRNPFAALSHSEQTKRAPKKCHKISRSQVRVPYRTPQIKWDTVPLDSAAKSLKTNESVPNKWDTFSISVSEVHN
jgi:hypothetical protein